VTYRPEALLVPDTAIFWYSLAAFGALILGGMGLPPIPEEGVVVAAGAWVASTPEYWPYNWVIPPRVYRGHPRQ
jgi:hypothetical protein